MRVTWFDAVCPRAGWLGVLAGVLLLVRCMTQTHASHPPVTVDRCTLYKLLEFQDMPGSLAHWVCLTLRSSGGELSRRGMAGELGLFQLRPSDCRQWGDTGSKLCGDIDCFALVDNAYVDDMTCAKRVYAEHGWDYWNAWIAHCRDHSNIESYIADCR